MRFLIFKPTDGFLCFSGSKEDLDATIRSIVLSEVDSLCGENRPIHIENIEELAKSNYCYIYWNEGWISGNSQRSVRNENGDEYDGFHLVVVGGLQHKELEDGFKIAKKVFSDKFDEKAEGYFY
jgi:hypothetical protein